MSSYDSGYVKHLGKLYSCTRYQEGRCYLSQCSITATESYVSEPNFVAALVKGHQGCCQAILERWKVQIFTQNSHMVTELLSQYNSDTCIQSLDLLERNDYDFEREMESIRKHISPAHGQAVEWFQSRGYSVVEPRFVLTKSSRF